MRRTAVLRGLGAALAVALVIGLGADAYAQSFFDSLPSVQGLDSATFAGDTVITDSTGKVVLADVGNQGDHRVAVKLKDVAPVAIEATVAIEDRGFYTNPGFDLAGIVRAAFDNLRAGHIVGGGSTITQQLAKQQFLTPDQTVSRKIKELAMAYELSQTYSKDQIMELYLNKSFYGSQSYGIEAAAESYFQIPASKLDLAQAAMLAGLPQAPTEWNPVLHPDGAKLRQTEVLRAMVRSNFISQEDMDKAVAEKLTYYSPTNHYKAPHFVDYVLAELRQLGFQPGIQQLNVQTTLDYNMQQIGESIVSSNLAANAWRDKRGVLSSGMVAMEPTTGDIKVMVGSPDYNSTGGQINFTTIPRNMGSSMKPYTYGAVINARAATVDTPVYDGPTPLVYKDCCNTTKIYNYDGKSHGVLPLKKAMGNSLNIAAVKVELSIGVPAVLSWMRNLNVRPRYVIANPDGSFAGYDANAPSDHLARARERHRDVRGHGRVPHAGGGAQGDRLARPTPVYNAPRPARSAGDRPLGRVHHGPDHVRRPEPLLDLRLQQRAALEGPHRRGQDRDNRQLQGRGHCRLHPRPRCRAVGRRHPRQQLHDGRRLRRGVRRVAGHPLVRLAGAGQRRRRSLVHAAPGSRGGTEQQLVSGRHDAHRQAAGRQPAQPDAERAGVRRADRPGHRPGAGQPVAHGVPVAAPDSQAAGLLDRTP